MEAKSPALALPSALGRIVALLSYVLVLIGPFLVLLFGRRDRFSLYHACQSLSLTLSALAAVVLWFAIGWIFTFFSVQFPLLYIIPVGAVLLLPVLQRRNRAARYSERGSWVGILLTLVVALVLVYGSWLVLTFLAPLMLPLTGPLLLMAGFSVVIAAFTGVLVAWVAGLVNALTARWKPVPLFGGWGERLYDRLTA